MTSSDAEMDSKPIIIIIILCNALSSAFTLAPSQFVVMLLFGKNAAVMCYQSKTRINVRVCVSVALKSLARAQRLRVITFQDLRT